MRIVKLPKPLEFEWDDGNQKKIYDKHRIIIYEAERAFANQHLFWFDEKHSHFEERYNLLGANSLGEILFITFTTRNSKIRIISARPADKRERETYDKEAEKNSKIQNRR